MARVLQVLVVGALVLVANARFLHSLPDDPYAFPKYRVSFLNGLPVLNRTAQRWLDDGLRGGEQEFLEQHWKGEIGNGEDQAPTKSTQHVLERMKLGPRDSYICLVPKPVESPVSPREEEEEENEATPARSWALLQPLTGTCIYHRQGWFTYSYCHNDQIRQFKELPPSGNRVPGASKPEEDPDWESYTLGRAPRKPEPGVDLTVAEQNAQAANLELARNAGSRYLVQRWSDGTICDKTGKSREVEVQFHCSMVMTDHILFVKETKTCSYVLVLHTPRLCGEPGFKSRRDGDDDAQIRCRQIVDVIPKEQSNLPSADYPLKISPRKAILPPPAAPKDDKGAASASADELFNDLVRKTLAALVNKKQKGGSGGRDGGEVAVEFVEVGDGEIVIEMMNPDDGEAEAQGDRLVDALRAAGHEVRAEKGKKKRQKRSAPKDEL